MPADSNDSDGNGSPSRRRYLQILGAAGAAGIAGCSGETPTGGGGGGTIAANVTEEEGDGTTEGEDTAGETSNGNLLDGAFTFSGGGPRVQFNPFNPTNYDDGRILFDRLASRRTPQDDYFPMIAQDWSISGQTGKIVLAENRQWSDGEPITSEDVLTRFRLGKYFGHSAWDYLSSMTAAGDYEIDIELNQSVNEKLLWNSILQTKINTPPQVFDEYLTRLQEAEGDEDALSEVQNEVLNFRLNDPICNGPFIWEEHQQQTFIYKKNPDYPEIDKINFDTIEWSGGDTKQKQAAALQAGQIDGVEDTFLTTSVIQQLPDHVVMCYLPAVHGGALYFDHTDEVYGKWRVRKAIAWAVDWESVANSANFGGADAGISQQVFQSHNTGVLRSRTDSYFENVQEQYESYMANVDREKAASLLQEAGFTRQDGVWHRPDGEPMQMPIKNPIEPSRNAATRALIAQLEEFGIQAELITVEGSTYWGKTGPEGNYRASVGPSWGGINASGYHPYYAYHTEFGDTTRVDATNFPATSVDIPEYGNIGGEYSQTVNPREKKQNLATTGAGSGDETRLVQELAWIWNQTLPCVAFTVTNDTQILTNDQWELPERDHPVLNEVRYPHEILFRPQIDGTRQGSGDTNWPHITAKTE